MWCTISLDKVFKTLEWILFIGFVITSGWFASGVLQQFFSRKTSFSQHKEKVTDYPVVNFVLGRPSSEIKPSEVEIRYKASGMAHYQYLEIGRNYLYNHAKYNKTEKVILESLENMWKLRGFRIIHVTPILKKNLARVWFQIEYNVENKTNSSMSDLVYFYITSRENSPGLSFAGKWEDGKQLFLSVFTSR